MITPTPDDIADELYGLAPQRFTETRAARARELRASGHADIADEVGRMRRPTQVAWLANVLVRRHGPETEILLGIGAELRAATGRGDRPQRAALSARRRGAVGALVALAADEARHEGLILGPAARRALEETLEAAVADEQATAALRSARLTGALRHVGFGDVASLTRSTPEPAPAKGGIDVAVQGAVQAVDGVRQALASADTELDDRRRDHEALLARRLGLEAELATLGGELAEVQARLERARRERARLVRALRSAEQQRDSLQREGAPSRPPAT